MMMEDKFIPKKKPPKEKKMHVMMPFTVSEYKDLVKAAEKAQVSLKSFCKQGVLFAKDRMDLS